MTTQHLNFALGRTLLEFLRHNPLLRELGAFFASLVRREPVVDTSIAWEDGEAEDRDRR